MTKSASLNYFIISKTGDNCKLNRHKYQGSSAALEMMAVTNDQRTATNDRQRTLRRYQSIHEESMMIPRNSNPLQQY